MTHNEDDEATWDLEETADVDMNAAVDKIMEEAAGADDSPTQFEASLSAARAEADEWRDRFMRKAAEFENYRKRMDKEKTELRIMAQSAILRDILPILDGFDRALKYFGEAKDGAGSVEQYREGVELLCRQALDTMTQAGVAPIAAEGNPFDPHLHEAISRYETPDAAEGTIVSELRRGYMFRDSLLRPSQVVVAAQPRET
jgi:molecular chaperone GrpE